MSATNLLAQALKDVPWVIAVLAVGFYLNLKKR